MIKGAVIVFWRLLTPAVFDYKASCDSSGRTIYEHMRRSPKQQPEELIAATAVVASCSEKGKQEGVDEGSTSLFMHTRRQPRFINLARYLII